MGAARRVGALQDLQVRVGDFGMETYPKIYEENVILWHMSQQFTIYANILCMDVTLMYPLVNVYKRPWKDPKMVHFSWENPREGKVYEVSEVSGGNYLGRSWGNT